MRSLLLVDRCGQTRLVLKPLLEEQGYELAFVPDAPAALEALWERPYALILVDMTDASAGGEMFLNALKSSDPAGRQKWAAFVGSEDEKTRERLLREGCSACLSKPINFHDLTMALSELMAVRKGA